MTKKKRIVKKTTTTTVVTEEVVNQKTQIVCVLDASSSMNSIINEARDGFNKFIEEQKELGGDATLTVATFNSSHDDSNGYNLLFNNVPLENVKPLTEKDWYGNGMTALYDAIGKTITDVNLEHKNLKKKDLPDKVLFVIVTDGFENASREFDQSSIKSLIKKQENNNWEFIYLGADQDAFSAGVSIGIKGGNTATYSNTVTGNLNMFATLSTATANYRSAGAFDSSTLMDSLTDDEGKIKED